MDREPSRVKVKCYAGYQGEETPRSFSSNGEEIEVTEVVDRWRTPDHRYFRVKGKDGGLYILRHDISSGEWDAREATLL
jgi:hypothetical protein